MYDDLVKRLREKALKEYEWCNVAEADFYKKAADAIEELSRQRDRAYDRLCEWCGVCPEVRRNVEDCEIAALNPEPPKEET